MTDMEFDYRSPAELFIPKRSAGRRHQRISYRRFATAAEAIRFAVEEFPAVRTLGAWMQVTATIAMRFADCTKVLDIHCAERRADLSRAYRGLFQTPLLMTSFPRGHPARTHQRLRS